MGVVRTTFVIDEQGASKKIKPDTNARELLSRLIKEWMHKNDHSYWIDFAKFAEHYEKKQKGKLF